MRYTLDTNVLLFYVRDGDTRQFTEEQYAPFDKQNESLISIVSVGEIMVLVSANNWGDRKLKLVQLISSVLTSLTSTSTKLPQQYKDHCGS
jgi:PIN domain nuclease of toxin-antitoxin system